VQVEKQGTFTTTSSAWGDGVVVRTLDLQPTGHRFESRPRNDPEQVVHTHVPLFTKHYKLVPAQAGAKQALHATHYSPVSVDLQLWLVTVWLRAIETEIIAALWALVAREGL